MPYIPDKNRDFNLFSTRNPGSLTYELYLICMTSIPNKPTYADFNTVLGCLEATKLELYRRWIAPYEDKKLIENGDVCPLEL